MTCPDENQLARLAEGALAPADRDELERHLDNCAACSTVLAVLAEVATDDYPQLLTIDPQHYVVGKEIARGGIGRIRIGRDRRLGRPVASPRISSIRESSMSTRPGRGRPASRSMS